MPAPKVLLLHGLLSGAVAWDGVGRELSSIVETVAPNLAGYGGERNPDGQYTLEALVDRLEPLLDVEQPTHILGHSMGGIVALALAARWPGRFERLGVVGLPVYHDREDGLAFIHQRGLLLRAVLRTDWLSHYGCSALYRGRTFWRPVVPFAVPRQPLTHVRAAFHHSRESHEGSLNRVVFANHVPRLAARTATPVVALHGGRDRSARIDRVRELAREQRWDLAVSPTAGHQIIIERPRLVARWATSRLLAPAPATKAISSAAGH